jgi:hypothetical protein
MAEPNNTATTGEVSVTSARSITKVSVTQGRMFLLTDTFTPETVAEEQYSEIGHGLFSSEAFTFTEIVNPVMDKRHS